MNTITDPLRIDKNSWNNFVLQHPKGNIFQTYEMFELYQKSRKYEPLLVAVHDDCKLVGILLALIQKEHKGFLGRFTARSIILGGPLVQDDDRKIVSSLLHQLSSLSKKRVIYTQFRNLHKVLGLKDVYEENGWRFEEHLNIIVDLLKSETTLWKGVHSTRRKQIARAKKRGTTIKVLKDKSDIKYTYIILREVYTNAKLPFPDLDFFEFAHDILTPKVFKIFLAMNEGKIIGTRYVLCFKDLIYDWYAGSYKAYYNMYPNDLIPWEVFLWGKKNGYKFFDFGGAGKPNIPYGVRDYKLKFGGELVNYGRFEKIHKPFLMELGKLGLKAYKILF